MRITILGAALLSLATVKAASSPCPLLGPDLPIPTALGDDISMNNTISELLRFLRPNATDTSQNLDIDYQNTSFSVNIYSAMDQQSLFSHHHAAPILQGHEYGTRTVNDTTIYRIGSISKLLTAYIYLLEVGDLSFNQPVTRYVPELAKVAGNESASALQDVDWDAITIGALASHMAGIPRDLSRSDSADRELSRLGFPPIQPGNRVDYCGNGASYPCNRTGT